MSDNKEQFKSAAGAGADAGDEVKALQQKILNLEKDAKCDRIYRDTLKSLLEPFYDNLPNQPSIDNRFVLEHMRELGWDEGEKECREHWDYHTDDEDDEDN